jgi:hypothetical protein
MHSLFTSSTQLQQWRAPLFLQQHFYSGGCLDLRRTAPSPCKQVHLAPPPLLNPFYFVRFANNRAAVFYGPTKYVVFLTLSKKVGRHRIGRENFALYTPSFA